MTRRGAAALALVLLLAGCARADGGSPGPRAGGDPAGDTLVFQVAWTGGFTTPEELAGRMPLVSVYADGRAIAPGPVAAIYPGPAWPNVLVTQLDPGQVQALVDRAVDAGVLDQEDLGRPGVADAATTRFIVRSGGRTAVRDVYALTEGAGDPRLTDTQRTARGRLQELAQAAPDLSAAGEPYRPAAVAVLARPWNVVPVLVPRTTQPLPDPPSAAWSGPALPGQPLPGGVGCLVVTGEEARAVTEAARQANARTRWTTPDGASWSLSFRPLLPHETGCADLTA